VVREGPSIGGGQSVAVGTWPGYQRHWCLPLGLRSALGWPGHGITVTVICS